MKQNINKLEKEIEEGRNKIIRNRIDIDDAFFIEIVCKEAKLQILQEVCKEIQVAFNKCSSCMLDIVKEKPRDNNTQRDWKQRIDELILLYSSISGLNYNEAKEELLNKLKSDEK